MDQFELMTAIKDHAANDGTPVMIELDDYDGSYCAGDTLKIIRVYFDTDHLTDTLIIVVAPDD